jgi:hypothetical protein
MLTNKPGLVTYNQQVNEGWGRTKQSRYLTLSNNPLVSPPAMQTSWRRWTSEEVTSLVTRTEMVLETLACSPFNHLELLAQEYLIEFYTLHFKKVRQVLVQYITANTRFIQTMFTNGVVFWVQSTTVNIRFYSPELKMVQLVIYCGLTTCIIPNMLSVAQSSASDIENATSWMFSTPSSVQGLLLYEGGLKSQCKARELAPLVRIDVIFS